jgi:hypothetical protein
MESEGLLQYSQKITTSFYVEPEESNSHSRNIFL